MAGEIDWRKRRYEGEAMSLVLFVCSFTYSHFLSRSLPFSLCLISKLL
jgi:hypothetical protein